MGSNINIKNCNALKRLIDGLKYYSSLTENIDDKPTQNASLQVYFNEEYTQILDDYYHVLDTHSNQLEDICKQLKTCNISKCKMAVRYYTNHNDQNEYDTDSKITFYLQILDQIHYWLYYQFDTGMRIKQNELMDCSFYELYENKEILQH